MKIIHCADLHLDSRMESNLSKEKADERKKELLQSFMNMVEYASKNEVQVILIAGDLFDTSSTQAIRIKKQVAYEIENNSKITFLYLRGNHDKDDYFASMENPPKNLKCFTDEWKTYKKDGVAITGREFTNRITDSTYDELNLSTDDVNIVTMHGQISNSDGKDDAPLINLKKLANKNIDYLALGHIHSYQYEKLDSRGAWCYSGCLEGRGFDECGEKGFVLLETDGKKIKHTFVPLSNRQCHCVEVELKGVMSYSEILKKIDDETSSIPKDDLVKVVLVGEISEDTTIDIVGFTQQLDQKFYFFKIEDKTQTEIDYRKYEGEVSLKSEFINYVKSQNVSDDEKTKIILTGLKALAGKEIGE